MTSRPNAVLAVMLAIVVSLALLVFAPGVDAQAATGRVTGTITSGTVGVAIADGVQVRLIVLDGSKVGDAVMAPVSGGRYAASVTLAPGRVFVPHLSYEGVDYFGDPVTFPGNADNLAEGAREANRDFLVYAVTREAPPLVIVSSTVTVVAIDRERGQIGVLREDLVANPADRVYIGDEQRVTLRIPAPTGTVEATGDNAEGTFTFERGVVTTTVPIRPGRLTSIVTRYVVGYDPRADRYALRVTAPLPTERLVVRVPEGYVRAVRPEAGARRAQDERLTGQMEGQVLQVVQSTGSVRPGGGVVVNLVGLATAVAQTNPLTEPRGAAIATALAIAIIGAAIGGVAVAARWRGRAA